MRGRLILIAGFISLSGCAKLVHLQELLTLKAMSDNGEQQKQYVQAQDAKFELLLQKVKSNQLSGYPHKKSVWRSFGEPILIKDVDRNGQSQEQWLYRYATKFFDSPKVYLYFDLAGKLLDWQYLELPAKK